MKKRIVKRVLALAMTVAMLFTMAACGAKTEGSTTGDDAAVGETGVSEEAQGSEENKYEETIPFTFTSVYSFWDITSGYDYENDAVYKYICEKFNVKPEVWACENEGNEEKISTWILSGTMPDSLNWLYFSLGETYYDYVDQGLLKPLPDGWEDKWPNLAKMVGVSGIADMLKVDGKTYGIPHSILGSFVEADGGMVSACDSIYFRKDWAEQVGMAGLGDDGTITVSEIEEYFSKVKEAGLTNIPITNAPEWFPVIFEGAYGLPMYRFSEFVETEDGFQWVPTFDGYTKVIEKFREWYKAGYIDPDFYSVNGDVSYAQNAFATGQTAAVIYGAAANDIPAMRSIINKAGVITDASAIGIAAITGDDGTYSQVLKHNFWGFQVFSPNTDDKTMERMLDMMDWLASQEGELTQKLGVPGVDWDYDEAGNPVVLETATDRSECKNVFLQFGGYCDDDFYYSGLHPDISAEDLAASNTLAALRNANVDYKVSNNYILFNGDEKTNYSVDIKAKITELACNDADIEKEWKKFIDENKAMWEPLVNALNAEYGY